MKNIKYKKLIIFIFLAFFFWASRTEAAQITLMPGKTTLGLHEQFYVDLLLSPVESINGIEGSIFFPVDKISFVGIETAQSVVPFWIEKPEARYGKINYAGMIPNGFTGLVDPFNVTEKKPGKIFRMIFEAKSSGNVRIEMSPTLLTLNDGLGTSVEEPANIVTLNIKDIKMPTIYRSDLKKESLTIKLSAEVVQDDNLYDGKYVLVFIAEDREVGIRKVVVREGSGDWLEVASPYLLKDQSRSSLISISAMNFAGESVSTSIEAIHMKLINKIFLAFFVPLILFIFIVRKYFHRNNETIS